MELIIAFLLAFGIATTDSAPKSMDEANKLIKKNELEKDLIIWELETDDF